MDAAGWLLVAVQAVWFVVLAGVGVLRRVRHRVLVTSGIGLLISLVVSTTATPVERALPLGVALGAGAAIIFSLATRRGVTFTFEADKVYWRDDSRLPRAENLVLLMTALAFCAAATVLATLP